MPLPWQGAQERGELVQLPCPRLNEPGVQCLPKCRFLDKCMAVDEAAPCT